LPSSFKDISFLISDYNKTHDLCDLLLNYKNNIIKNVYIFDYYNNEERKETKIGFRFVFQSKEITLTSSEIELVYNDIVSKCLKIEGIVIPGLN